VYKVALKL